LIPTIRKGSTLNSIRSFINNDWKQSVYYHGILPFGDAGRNVLQTMRRGASSPFGTESQGMHDWTVPLLSWWGCRSRMGFRCCFRHRRFKTRSLGNLCGNDDELRASPARCLQVSHERRVSSRRERRSDLRSADADSPVISEILVGTEIHARWRQRQGSRLLQA